MLIPLWADWWWWRWRRWTSLRDHRGVKCVCRPYPWEGWTPASSPPWRSQPPAWRTWTATPPGQRRWTGRWSSRGPAAGRTQVTLGRLGVASADGGGVGQWGKESLFTSLVTVTEQGKTVTSDNIIVILSSHTLNTSISDAPEILVLSLESPARSDSWNVDFSFCRWRKSSLHVCGGRYRPLPLVLWFSEKLFGIYSNICLLFPAWWGYIYIIYTYTQTYL